MEFFIWIWLVSQLGSTELAMLAICAVVALIIGGIVLLRKSENLNQDLVKIGIFVLIISLLGMVALSIFYQPPAIEIF